MHKRTAESRYFLLLHVVEGLHSDIDKDELRANIRIAWHDELEILGDVFDMHQARMHASSIFKGAHVVVYDGGERYEAWSKLRTRREPPGSSHQSDKTQYFVSGPCCHTILFGMTDGHTWFQLENNSTDDLWPHLADWFVYRITHKNQGPYGSSPHTDKHPIRITHP